MSYKQDDIDRRIQTFQDQVILDYTVFPYLWATELILYTLQLVYIFCKHHQKMKKTKQLVAQFILFELLFIGSTVNITLFNIKLSKVDQDHNWIKVQQAALIVGEYDRLNMLFFLFMMYQLLFHIKKVEIQINNCSYTSMERKIREIQRAASLEKLFLIIYLLVIIVLVVVYLILQGQRESKDEDGGQQVQVNMTYYILSAFFVFLNFFMIIWFTRMAWYFVEAMDVDGDLQNGCLVKILLLSIDTIISIGLYRMFLEQNFIDIFEGELLIAYLADSHLVVMRITRYFSQICPFIIATYLTYVIVYFVYIREADQSTESISFRSQRDHGAADQSSKMPVGSMEQREGSINNDSYSQIQEEAMLQLGTTCEEETEP